MSEEKTVLLSIKLDTGDLKKRSEEASANILDLKKRQSELDKTTKEGALAYVKLNAEIKAQTLVLNQSAKSIEINERLGNKQNLSLKEQGELLSAGKVALRNLTTEQIANTESGQQLNKEVNDLNESLKKSEAGYGVHVREVGNYDKGIRGLKAELKDLKSIMVGLDAGSKEYQQASEKAGVLGDKIKEVNENVKASSGGTGFEKLSNNLGLVKGNLMNLDFAGVSENMKQMAVISKGMTFKEVLGGLKNMGSALLSLGKAILANPLFLMVGVIVAVVGALKMWSDYSAEQAVKAQDKHTKAIENNIKSIQDQQKWLEKTTDLELKRAELQNKSAEEVGKLKLKYLKETNENSIKEQQAFQKLANKLASDIKKTSDEDRIKDLKDKQEDAEKSYVELFNENQLYEDKKRNLVIENNNNIREANKIANEKITADNKKAEEDRLAIAYKIKDLILDNEDKKNENQSKIIEAHYKFLEETANGNTEELLKIQEEKNAKLTQLDLDIYNDAISRQEENYKREQKDAKGNAQLLAQLKIKNQLEIDKINNNFDNAQKERENKQLKDAEDLNKSKVESERKASQEIELINAELNYLKSKGNLNEQKEFENFQNARIKVLQENAKTEIELKKLVGVEADAINSKLALESEKIQSEELKKTEKKEEKKTEKQLTDKQLEQQKIATVTLNSAVQLTDALSSITQNRIANELTEEKNKNDDKNKFLKEQLDANLITETEYNTKKSAIDVEYKAIESKLKTEAFKKEKEANLIKAIMNTATGVAGALPNIPLSILAGVLGAVQVSLIASQPVPKFAKGGLFGGQSHSNGGTKGYFEDGTQIEVEKDESFFILNKRATPLISQLSNLNTSTGGVPLMANGGAIKFANGGAVASSLSNSLDNQLNAQNQLLRMIELMPKPVVIVQDINDAQGNLATVENRANF